MLTGEYDESESARSFQEALLAWRKGDDVSSGGNAADGGKPASRPQTANAKTQTKGAEPQSQPLSASASSRKRVSFGSGTNTEASNSMKTLRKSKPHEFHRRHTHR